jgi:hypothetical protein
VTDTQQPQLAAARSGAPAASWLALSDVTAWLKLGAPDDDDARLLEFVIAQTEQHVQHVRADCWQLQPGEDGQPARVFVPDAETYQGAVMYAARSFRRRNSPTGVQSFGEAGVSFVARWDADIDRALRTGAFTPPAVG